MASECDERALESGEKSVQMLGKHSSDSPSSTLSTRVTDRSCSFWPSNWTLSDSESNLTSISRWKFLRRWRSSSPQSPSSSPATDLPRFRTCISHLHRFGRDRSKETDGFLVGDVQIGYPNVATFLDSDAAFRIYRRFGYISSRLLLDKQAKLCQLERKLDRMDQYDSTEKDRNILIQTRDLPEQDSAPRRQLLEELEAKFREYGKLSDLDAVTISKC
jgi:hypothetical protein